MSEQYPKIYISRTQKEWDVIDRRIKELNKSDLGAFLRSKIGELEKEYLQCPNCICSGVGKKVQRHQYLPAQQFKILLEISEKTGIAEGVIVNKLIIEPLLFIP